MFSVCRLPVVYFVLSHRNYDAELFAFGKRLGEEFDENILRTAFIHRFVNVPFLGFHLDLCREPSHTFFWYNGMY